MGFSISFMGGYYRYCSLVWQENTSLKCWGGRDERAIVFWAVEANEKQDTMRKQNTWGDKRRRMERRRVEGRERGREEAGNRRRLEKSIKLGNIDSLSWEVLPFLTTRGSCRLAHLTPTFFLSLIAFILLPYPPSCFTFQSSSSLALQSPKRHQLSVSTAVLLIPS